MGVPASCCVVDTLHKRPVNFTNMTYHEERTLCENLEGKNRSFKVENEPERNTK